MFVIFYVNIYICMYIPICLLLLLFSLYLFMVVVGYFEGRLLVVFFCCSFMRGV